tara:strand:+ start:224 stop:481 length:258 start_codon:yes stop_codon:yes gene_type:complete
MKNYFETIEKKIRSKLKLEKLEIVDNSYKHKGHKSFSPERYHLKLILKSKYLSSIPRLNAHKIINEILKEELKTKIHALEINIET